MTNSLVSRLICVGFGTLLAIGASAGLDAQRGGPPRPALADTLVGSESFSLYCASCHGADGRGNGPVAGALRSRPADLTVLARTNGGRFPKDRVRASIVGTGATLTAHGTSEMPVWGSIFRAFEADARVQVRIDNLVTHIESMQAPSSGADAPGAVAFRTYCASCHGTDARGSGVLASELRRQPPDLTRYTQRNGGVFPGERVRRIVDGRDIRAHGTSEMPVWGDAFRARPSGLTAEQANQRIADIVGYLQAIQERPAE